MGLVNLVGEIALEDTQKNVQRGFTDAIRRFDWVLVGGGNKPKYIGVAPRGSGDSDPVWEIAKYTFILGPDAVEYIPAAIETAVGAWDDRTVLLP